MADEEDYSALPLEQRLTHKAWKARADAYAHLTKELKQLDADRQAGQFNIYENYLSKMILDTNMAAQEAGLATAIAFVQNAPNPTRRREEMVAGVVTKCLAATKAGTRALSLELLLLLSEVDNPGPVVTGVIEGFDAKQPKAVAAAVTAVREIVRAFGVKLINLKVLLKALAKPFSHKDNSVRAETQQLAVELYRWMRQAILPSLQDLPPVLLKDLESQFAAVASEPLPRQARLLRSQQEAEEFDSAPAGAGPQTSANANAAGNANNSAAAEEESTDPGVDAWELADPVDITKKLPDDFYEMVMSSKWKERKDAIQQLHDSLQKAIRLQNSPGTGDLIQEMGKKIADINIIVATVAIQSLGLFALGLRQPFAPYVQSTLPALIERSKERKQTVIDAIRLTTDAYFAAAGHDLSTIGDHYFTGASHKNPQVRAESNHFLRRCLAMVSARPGKGDIKRYSEQLKAGLDDGDAGVRESAAECLGTLSKLVTSKVLEPFIEGIDKIKMDKVNEHAEKATIKLKALEASAKAAAIKKAQREGKPIDEFLPADDPPSPAPTRAPPAKRPAAAGASSAAPAARKPPAAASASAARPGVKGKPAPAKDLGETIRMRIANDDSIDEKIVSALPASVLGGFESSAWKERMEAMDELKEYLGDQAVSGSGIHPELVIRQLARKPGWKESNFQVNARAFQIIEWMAGEESLDFSTGAAALSVPPLVEKLGDIKLKAPAASALVAIAERYSLKLVAGLATEPIRSQKSPKVLADCIAWLDTQMIEFGTRGLALRPLVSMVKEVGLQSSNAQTRARAVTFMGTLRRAIGSAVMDLLDDLNPQLVQLLEAEFDKVGSQPMPEPIRTQRSLADSDMAGGGGGASASTVGGGGGGDDPMDDLFPRQDLHALVGSGIYKQLGDSNWKERKAGLDAILGALESANHRILPNISGDLYTALKQRLQDANKNLITVTLGLLAALSTDSGTAQPPNIRIVALTTIQCLADKKPQLRVAAVAAMTAWANATPASVEQAVLPAIPSALADISPELRLTLLQWLADVLTPRHAKGVRLPDLSLLITPLFTCLQDRNADVRKQAQRVLELTVASCGFEAVHDACEMQLRGAAKASVAPMIEEFRHTVGATASSGGMDGGPLRRAGAPPASSRARPGPADSSTSPVPDTVMTAAELLGRQPTSQGRQGPAAFSASSGAAATSAVAAASGPGMLRRPMAVRRPVGAPASGLAAGAPGARPLMRPTRGQPDAGRPGTPSSLSMASQMARMSNEELESIPPILDCDFRAKEQRARRDMSANPNSVPRWAHLGDSRVRGDLEAQLSEQMSVHFNPLIYRLLFSTGHYKDRDFLSGLTTIEEVISITSLSQQRFGLPLFADMADEDSLASRYMANIDLLLKYISIRMYDGSTHTLLKSFELLERLIQMTEESQQQQQARMPTSSSWTDYEVQAVLPALIGRLGDAKEVVRARSRRLLTQLITHLYPPTKLFTTLLEHGVINKSNARIRQESLDCLAFLIRERTAGLGLSAVCAQPARAIPIIAQGIADRDSNVRTATLNVLVTVGEQLPGGADELWRLCGRIAEKERTMLEEKLKRSTIGVGSSSSQAGGDIGGMRPNSRAGLAPPVGIRARSSQYGAPAGSASGPGSRPASAIGRPTMSAGGGSLPRNGSGIGAGGGMGAGRLARPGGGPSTSAQAYGTSDSGMANDYSAYSQQPQRQVPAAQYGASSAKPMFSLDFDNLNLPSYSSATAEQLGGASGSGRPASLRPGTAPAPPPYEQQTRAANPDLSSAAIGYGASRSDSLQSALSGLQISLGAKGGSSGNGGGAGSQHERAMPGSHSIGSPSMAAASASRPMSMVYSAPRNAADFARWSKLDREQWMEGVVADLSSDDSKAAEKAMERLQGLLDIIEPPTAGAEAYAHTPVLDSIRKNVGNITSALAVQLRWAFTTTSTDPSMVSPFQSMLINIRKLSLHLLLGIFDDRRLAQCVREDALLTVVEEMIRRLVDPLLKRDDDADSKVARGSVPNYEWATKSLNAIVVKILDKADRTTVYVVLIRLLQSSMAVPVPNPPPTDSDTQRVGFGDLAMRCLWRLTKPLEQELQVQFGDLVASGITNVPASVGSPEFGDIRKHPFIRIDPILRITHRFFEHVPDREWRKREDRSAWMFGDLPKRTVKTIGHMALCRLRGLVWQFTGLILHDVITEHPGLIHPPPLSKFPEGNPAQDSDPAMLGWLSDVHTKMSQASETWAYLQSSLSTFDESYARPTVSQLMAALRVAQAAADDDGDSDDDSSSVTVGGLGAGAPPAYARDSRPGSVVSSSSPLMQARQPLGMSAVAAGERAQSPALAASRTLQGYTAPNRAASPMYSSSVSATGGGSAVHSPSQIHASLGSRPVSGYANMPSYTAGAASTASAAGAGGMSSQERLRALRERIHGSQSSAARTNLSPQMEQATISPASAFAPAQAPAAPANPPPQNRSAGSSDGVPNMDDIRARIARMRSSLRDPK
ncbi:hypothetical protein IWW39_000317 [Coemansia spiralis]|uniref:TOG domain-containing protein n=1 Tax=Coemansia spiralis TaxID=417178 RepID=A0A9W8GRZ7_9FUNG|nr:hypothetical protein IWW39_000317 [Coemansia spiralis]